MGDKRQDIQNETKTITGPDHSGGPVLLYASPEVEERVAPIKDFIPDWIKHLEGVDPNIEIYFVSENEMGDVRAFFNALPLKYRMNLSSSDFIEMNEQILPAGCQSVDTNGDGLNDLALIQISKLENYKHFYCTHVLARQFGLRHDKLSSAESFLAFYEQLSPEIITSFNQIPGTDQDWDIATLAHEIGHLGHDGEGLSAEQSADQFMFNMLSDGAIIQQGVVEADIAFRALKSIFSFEGIPHFNDTSTYTHVTNVGVHSHKDDQIIAPADLVTNEDKLKLLEFLASPFCYGETGLIKKPDFIKTDPADLVILENTIYEVQNLQNSIRDYKEGSAEWHEA